MVTWVSVSDPSARYPASIVGFASVAELIRTPSLGRVVHETWSGPATLSFDAADSVLPSLDAQPAAEWIAKATTAGRRSER